MRKNKNKTPLKGGVFYGEYSLRGYNKTRLYFS